MTDSFEQVGAFWRPEIPGEVLTGILRSRKGRLTLCESPTYSVIDPLSFSRLFSSDSDDGSAEHVSVLHGRLRDGACTLYSLQMLTDAGVTDLGTQESISAPRWRVGLAVIGAHLADRDVAQLSESGFQYSHIQSCLPTAIRLSRTGEGTQYTTPLEPLTVFELSSEALGAYISCQVLGLGSFSRKSDVRLLSVPRLRVSTFTPQTLRWHLNLAYRFEKFFSLFLGTCVELKRLELYIASNEGSSIIRRLRSRKQKPDLQMQVHCTPEQLQEAMSRWLAKPDAYRPIEEVILGMIPTSQLYIETEFLSLAQALEALGRAAAEPLLETSKFKAGLLTIRKCIKEVWPDQEIGQKCIESLSHVNELSFSGKTRKLLDGLDSSLLSKVVGDPEEFVKRLVNTRNYYTHLGIGKTTHTINDGTELFLFNQRIHALIRALVLVDLGLPETAFRKAVIYQATRFK